MSRSFRQFIAVLLAIWLPLAGGNALAASMSMQLPAGHCQDESMQMTDMGDMDMSAHHASDADDGHNPSCNICGVCHLACSGYLAVHGIAVAAAQVAARQVTPYAVSFHSITSTPLVPPPLARA